MAFTPELYLHDRPGPPIDFIHGPHQWINATIRTRAVRARDAAGELTRPVSLCLSHIGLGLAWRLLRTTDPALDNDPMLRLAWTNSLLTAPRAHRASLLPSGSWVDASFQIAVIHARANSRGPARGVGGDAASGTDQCEKCLGRFLQ